MTPLERSRWFLLTGLRALLSLLDLAGVLAIGFIVTSTAIFLTSGSDADRVLEFAGLSIPAVNAQSLPWISGSVLFVFLIKALFSILLTKRAALFIARVEARAAKTLAEISFGGDLSHTRTRSKEEATFAIQVGSPSAFNVLLNSLNSIISESALFLVICIGFAFVDPAATLGAIVYFGVVAFVIQYFVGSLMTKAGLVAAESAVRANTAISDLLSVFRELLVLGKRDSFIDAIYKARVAAAGSSATHYYLSGMPRYIIEAALLVGVAIFVLVQALSGDIIRSAGTIGVFLSGGFRLTAALLPLQNALLTMNSVVASANTANQILSLRVDSRRDIEEDYEREPPQEKESGPLGIEVKNVSFTYPDALNAAVADISFEIAAGSQIALMGPSGAGKSTIADLLCRVLEPTAGSITLVGSKNSSFKALKGQVSYLPQSPGLVSGTIAENVALAEKIQDIDRAKVLQVMNLAHLGELLAELPQGIDTPLGKLKDGLSGGQIQRLGLARALYSEPGLLVMDEATSALDAESEEQIQKALSEMRGKVTVVLIAHRLNTIQHADTVILVESGRVKDSGTFKELISRNPGVERVVDLMRIDKT
ncbi:MAG: hypothetical protein RLZZ610_866 [Actinomycetota bacterium]